MSETQLTEQAAIDAAASAVEAANKRGGSAAEAGVSAGVGLAVTVRNGELETIEHYRDKTLSLTVYDGQRKGSATTSDLSAGSVIETVEAALRIARSGEPDPYAGLLEEKYLARDYPTLDLDFEWDLSPEQATDLALEIDAAARRVDDRIEQVDDSSVSRYRGLSAYVTSTGFAGAYRASRYSQHCVAVGRDDGGMQRSYWFTSARDPEDLEAAVDVGRIAGERTAARLGARKGATCTVPVLFENRLAASLVGHLLSAIAGRSQYRKSSFLLDAAGEQIFPAFMTMEERPHLPKAIGSAPFDDEGAPTRNRALVDAGVLQGYLLSSYAARRLGLEPTGNAGGVHNLSITPGTDDFDALVRRLDTGLVVTEMMGMGINIVTGDYSRGASGFWVENGEIKYPIEEITVAGNLAEMFRDVVATGNDVDERGNVRTGSWLIESMTVAGN